MKKIGLKNAIDFLKEKGMEIDFTAEAIAGIVRDHFPKGLSLRRGWRQKMWIGIEGIQIRIYNPMLASKGVPEAFYVVQNETHPYGAPLIDEEPSLGIATDYGFIVGVVVEDEDGNVRADSDGKPMRFSWSNLHNQGRQYEIIDGQFFLDGQSLGFIRTLYAANKNRIQGLIAGVGPQRPAGVAIKELEDVRLIKL